MGLDLLCCCFAFCGDGMVVCLGMEESFWVFLLIDVVLCCARIVACLFVWPGV